MNLKRRAFGHQHGHAAHLAQLQSNLDIGSEESIFNRAGIGLDVARLFPRRALAMRSRRAGNRWFDEAHTVPHSTRA